MIKALDNRFYVRFMQLEIGLFSRFHYPENARSRNHAFPPGSPTECIALSADIGSGKEEPHNKCPKILVRVTFLVCFCCRKSGVNIPSLCFLYG